MKTRSRWNSSPTDRPISNRTPFCSTPTIRNSTTSSTPLSIPSPKPNSGSKMGKVKKTLSREDRKTKIKKCQICKTILEKIVQRCECCKKIVCNDCIVNDDCTDCACSVCDDSKAKVIKCCGETVCVNCVIECDTPRCGYSGCCECIKTCDCGDCKGEKRYCEDCIGECDVCGETICRESGGLATCFCGEINYCLDCGPSSADCDCLDREENQNP